MKRSLQCTLVPAWLRPFLMLVLLVVLPGVAFHPAVARSSGPLVRVAGDVADIIVDGIDPYDQLGAGAAKGDFNGDGFTDLAVSAYLADPLGRENAGETYVFFGPVDTGPISASASDLTIVGRNAGDFLGVGLATGDLNNDGDDDLVLAAFEASPLGRSRAGETFVLFGPLSSGLLDLRDRADLAVAGATAGDFSGHSVAAGDVNGDGVCDLAVGAPFADPGAGVDAGALHVLFGPLAPGTGDLAADSDITLTGESAGDLFAAGVAVGDVTGDQAADLLVGAMSSDPGGRQNAGMTYVIRGPISPSTSLTDGENIARLNGPAQGNELGFGIGTGDIDNDGIADIALGGIAVGFDGTPKTGSVYVVPGKIQAGNFDVSQLASQIIYGDSEEDLLGAGVAIGDLNGDQLEDLTIGAYKFDGPGGTNAGRLFVWFGVEAAQPPPVPGLTALGLLGLALGLGVLTAFRCWNRQSV